MQMTRAPEGGILLVEDNPDVVMLIEEIIREHWRDLLVSAPDGEAALSHLRGCIHANEALPDLMLLDLKLPGRDGWEVLDLIRQDPELRRMPVVILSSSTSPEDVERAYSGCANAYVAKPSSLTGYLEALDAIEQFWFDTATLPG